MSRKCSIHVSYGSDTKILAVPREGFLFEVSRRFDIPEKDIEIYEVNRKKRNKISVESLKSVMKVEIRRKTSQPGLTPNGHSSSKPLNQTTNDPTKEAVIKKLKEGTTLNGPERKYLLEVLTQPTPECSNSLKRKREDDCPKMKHAKTQVTSAKLFLVTEAFTQTDLAFNAAPKRSITTVGGNLEDQMKRMARLEKKDPERVAFLMNETYNTRRNYIIKEFPVVKVIKEKYPLLFSLSEVQNEIDRIIFAGKSQIFYDNVKKYVDPILSTVAEDNEMSQLTARKANAADSPQKKMYAQEVGSILLISRLVNEQRQYLKLTDSVNQIAAPENLPYITADVRLADLFEDNVTFKVIVEKIQICEASNFREAIFGLIASYFIFDIKYTEENFNTLVTFEKIYLEATDTAESDIDDSIRQKHKMLILKKQNKSR